MIKKRNNIRFGNKIYIVENIDDDNYLLRESETNRINWVSKNIVHKAFEKMTFKSLLTENASSRRYFFENKYLTVQVNPCKEGSIVSILTENTHWAKYYDCNTSKALYNFNKYFNYTNELTPYKLTKQGFKQLKGSN